MPYSITPHTGVNIVPVNITPDDLVQIHLDDGYSWVLSAKKLPQLRLDREFIPREITAPELSLDQLSAAELPDLRW